MPVLSAARHGIAQQCPRGDEQVQRPIGTPVGDLDRQCFLPPTQSPIVRNGPVQVCPLQRAGYHPCRLSQRQLEEDLDRKTKLDRCVGEHRRPTGATVMRREPSHLPVQPDQKGPALAKRRSVAGPIRRAIAGGCWLAHPARLTAWIRRVNPSRTEFCNNAGCIRRTYAAIWHFQRPLWIIADPPWHIDAIGRRSHHQSRAGL
jgi:hypothetical protein